MWTQRKQTVSHDRRKREFARHPQWGQRNRAGSPVVLRSRDGRKEKLYFGDVPEPLNQKNPKACPALGLSDYSRYFLIVKVMKRLFATSKVLTDILKINEENGSLVH